MIVEDSNHAKLIDCLKLNQQEWDELVALLEKKKSSQDYLQYVELAMQMKILAPERFSFLNLENEAIGEAEKLLNLYYQEQNWLEFVNIASPIKIILPDKISQIKSSEQVKAGLSLLLEQYRISNLWSFVALASKIKIIFPEQIFILDIEDDEELWKDIFDELKTYRGNNKWRSYTSMAAAIKIAFPKKFIEVEVDSVAQDKMFELLEIYRQSFMWDQLAIQAFRIKILVFADNNLSNI
jgi:hypothetical protein